MCRNSFVVSETGQRPSEPDSDSDTSDARTVIDDSDLLLSEEDMRLLAAISDVKGGGMATKSAQVEAIQEEQALSGHGQSHEAHTVCTAAAQWSRTCLCRSFVLLPSSWR